jgi:hypothetical protein
MFDTPILYLIFNRTDLTEITFLSICNIKPKKLFIAADGPRSGNKNDEINCKLVREFVLSKIDWDCNVKTLFRDENLGCGKAVSSAITWFFSHVEEGIILEDDCLPDFTFFRFCTELLKKYRKDDQIMILSGFNPIGKSKSFNSSYTFSTYSGIWGWATWKRAWLKYDYLIPEWHNPHIRQQVLSSFKNQNDARILESGLDSVLKSECDTWDYQWGFYRTLFNGLGIIPKYNMISNLGFGLEATHTVNSDPKVQNLPRKSIKFPLKHPIYIENNESFDDEYNSYFRNKYRKSNKSIFVRCLNKLLNEVR